MDGIYLPEPARVLRKKSICYQRTGFFGESEQIRFILHENAATCGNHTLFKELFCRFLTVAKRSAQPVRNTRGLHYENGAL